MSLIYMKTGMGSSETYYHLSGLARRLVLKQRQRANMVALFALLFSSSLHTNNKPPANLTWCRQQSNINNCHLRAKPKYEAVIYKVDR